MKVPLPKSAFPWHEHLPFQYCPDVYSDHIESNDVDQPLNVDSTQKYPTVAHHIPLSTLRYLSESVHAINRSSTLAAHPFAIKSVCLPVEIESSLHVLHHQTIRPANLGSTYNTKTVSA